MARKWVGDRPMANKFVTRFVRWRHRTTKLTGGRALAGVNAFYAVHQELKHLIGKKINQLFNTKLVN